MVVRFAPIDPGEWEYRISSNLKRFDGKEGKFTAAESDYPGFIIPANGHHWRYTEGRAAHLWMGDTYYAVGFTDDQTFRTWTDERAGQKFNHVRGYAIGREGFESGKTFRDPDTPNTAFYKRLDDRVAYLNSKGITFDLIAGHGKNFLAKEFPMAVQRERYLRYLVARYSSFNITWELTEHFEEYENGREILKQMGLYLQTADPYKHPRSTHADVTSGPLLADGWMDHLIYSGPDNASGAIEHQLYAVPAVNAGFAQEKNKPGEFRHQLWNSFMNGQYLTAALDPTKPDSPDAQAMTAWYELIAGTRYWEFEPYFDLDGGRAIALPDTEYIVYVEKPSGPIEVRVEKHEYEVKWINPATGEVVPQKSVKTDKFTGEPPDRDHDWVLHLSREGRKEGMLKSWKFESRPFLVQETEAGAKQVPFEIAEPKADEITLSKPPAFAAKLRRETRGTRSMMYLWTGDVPIDGQGYRVLGSGPAGTWKIPQNTIRTMPGVMNVRVYGMNANGKVYLVDRIYRLVP
ncbi:MAG: DUF4038 domain-containing protein [Bryobacteraceae bacterium]|nr:DUF4038 domain-containing protein [Bryobacteraceae bacterium]